jgi:hypothetical protein
VHRLEGERLENQEVERALGQVESGVGHVPLVLLQVGRTVQPLL